MSSSVSKHQLLTSISRSAAELSSAINAFLSERGYELSIVIPVYNEEKLVEELWTQLELVLSKTNFSYEVIFIDDGSIDNTSSILRRLAQERKQLKVLRLSRNFGQQSAFSAGISYASGKAVILMDADLQDSPDAIPLFIERWREGYDVVFAIRKDRKERTSKRWAYSLFYKLLSWLADSPIPRDAGDFCLLDRKVVNQIKGMPEHHRFLRGMRSWVGFKQIGVPIVRGERYSGSPKYTLRKLFKLALDGFLTSSTLPLRAIAFIGLLLAVFSTILAGVYVYLKLSSGLGPPGFATLVVIVCFFSGIQLMLLGIVGEYLGRVFEQVRGRPNYIVDEVIIGNASRHEDQH